MKPLGENEWDDWDDSPYIRARARALTFWGKIGKAGGRGASGENLKKRARGPLKIKKRSGNRPNRPIPTERRGFSILIA
jgi:hypothetical protein